MRTDPMLTKSCPMLSEVVSRMAPVRLDRPQQRKHRKHAPACKYFWSGLKHSKTHSALFHVPWTDRAIVWEQRLCRARRVQEVMRIFKPGLRARGCTGMRAILGMKP